MVYLITYDLNRSGKDYEGVIKAIHDASTGVWCRVCQSSWLINANAVSADVVYDKIAPYLDGDDVCLVVEVKNNMQGWLPQELWNYIKSYMLP